MAARRSGTRHLMLAGPQARVLQTAFRSVRTGPAAYAHGTGHAAADPGQSADSVTDPLCGMTVDPAGAPAHAGYAGQAYCFCSDGCARQFAADPLAVLTEATDPVRGMPVRVPDAVHRPARRRRLLFLPIRVQGSLRRRRGRAGRPPGARRAAAAWAAERSSALARGRKTSSASVSSVPCGVRSNSRAPRSCSSRRTCRLREDCATRRAAAARPKCQCSATTVKYRTMRRSRSTGCCGDSVMVLVLALPLIPGDCPWLDIDRRRYLKGIRM